MVSCNLNDRIRFRLTNYGKQVLEDYLKEQREKYGIDAHELYKTDCCGDMRLHLHDFMNVFGSHCVMGESQIIEHNELVFVGE
jgi:hypothetical protein